jgi:hypothetical protein
VISLERAVAIGRAWAYLAPALAAAGGVALIISEAASGAVMLLFASVMLLVASIAIYRRQREAFNLTLAVGTLCWVSGNAAWIAGASAEAIVTWWLCFLVVTIAAERLELSRFLPPSPAAKRLFAAALALLLAGAVSLQLGMGARVLGAGLVAVAAWLVTHDLARRTIRKQGLTRFIAACLLSGYAWLAAGGAIGLVAGELARGTPAYDAAVHALALGFVFSMIFGHAPIVFPAILRVRMPYYPTFYVPLVLLHVSLLVRLAGDFAGHFTWTRVGALGNAIALGAFLLGTIASVALGRRTTASATTFQRGP